MFEIGDLVTFNYKGNIVHDENPRVLVLHNQWACSDKDTAHRCLHGLNFNKLFPSEKDFICAVLNPQYEAKIVKKNKAVAKQMEIVHAYDSLTITSPEDFYQRLIRPFIKPRGWHPYRRYRLDKIFIPHVVVRKAIMVGDEQDTRFQNYIKKVKYMRGKRVPFGY